MVISMVTLSEYTREEESKGMDIAANMIHSY